MDGLFPPLSAFVFHYRYSTASSRCIDSLLLWRMSYSHFRYSFGCDLLLLVFRFIAWLEGIEVKPGKPVKHSCDKVQRRLQISQATLGIGTATKTSFVQCNVGNKHLVFLCALLPDKTESCHLDLEFEEPDDVVFSVLGPRSVFLTGYYVNNRSNTNFGSDSESYGEDIAVTESEKSDLQTDDDEYEDSFIHDDDDDRVVSPASASPTSNGKVDEKLEHSKKKKKTKEKNDTHNPQRRKFVVVDSDDDASSQDSDKDNYLLSVFKNKKAAKASASGGEKMAPVCQEPVEADDKKADGSLKETDGFVNNNKELESEPGLVKKKKLKRKRKDESDELKSLGDKDVKAPQADAGADGQLHSLPSQEKKKPTSDGNIGGHDNLTHPAEASPQNKKPKKKAKVRDVEQIYNDNNDGASSKNVILHPNHEIENVDKITGDLQKVEDKKTTAESDASPDLVVDGGNLQKTKKKKKKGKRHENSETLNSGGTPLADHAIREPSKASDVKKCHLTSSSHVRTLSSGLVVEDLSFGDKEGKVAALGKKVKIFYSVMLKENGQVLDSNFGKTPYRFRLGDEGIIEGWNVGLEGMRVGDKRRLTIPPAMGYGSQGGTGENIPPNSWLVYDVELVSVR